MKHHIDNNIRIKVMEHICHSLQLFEILGKEN